MIKKRSRPQTRTREILRDDDDDNDSGGAGAAAAAADRQGSESDGAGAEANLPVHELIELRKLRKQRLGIDAAKLSVGDAARRRRKKQQREGEGEGEGAEDGGEGGEGEHAVKPGLRPGAGHVDVNEGMDDDLADKDAKARRAVRTNNFTQQTNTLDVDKHMMAYIEENMKMRRSGPGGGPGGQTAETSEGVADDDDDAGAANANADLSPDANNERRKAEQQRKVVEEGSVAGSMAMLAAIPEVDLGMDARLKNIEDTEKAKMRMTYGKDKKRQQGNDEERLASTRYADIIRDAKREAMGLPPQDEAEFRPRYERPQLATDEMVMERFKKRMRK